MRFLSIFAAAVFVFTGCSESDKTTTTVAPTTDTVIASTTITTTTTTSSPAQTLSAALDTMWEKLAENIFDKKTWEAAWSSLSSLAEAIKPEDQREFVVNYLVKRQALIKSAWEKVPAEKRDNTDLAAVFELITEFCNAPEEERKAAAEKLVSALLLASEPTNI